MSFLLVMSALPRSATAQPGRSERVGAWGPYRGPHVQVVAVVASRHEFRLPVMSALSRSATASPGRSERVGDWGPYRGPYVDQDRRGERAKFFVRARAVAPHDHREARRAIQDRQRVVPRARVIGDAVAGPGEKRHGARRIGPPSAADGATTTSQRATSSG